MLETRLRNTGSTAISAGSGGGTPVTSGTPGSVLFVDSSGNLAQDNANLFWDDTANSLILSGTSAATLTSATNKDFNLSANGTGHLWLSSNNFRLLTTGFGSTVLEMDSSGRFGINATPESGHAFILGTGGATVRGLTIRGASSQSANLQEWQDSSGTALAYLTPNTVTDEGGLAFHLFARSLQDRGLVFDPGGANTRPKISTLASAGFNLNDGAMFGPSFSDEGLPNFIPDGIRFGRDVGNYSIRWSPRANDTAVYSLSITGQEAYTTATSTNQNGGPINITGGTAASDSGKTGVGGNIVLNGGVKSPSGTDGNVILSNSRGMVGIGTLSPGALLDVRGASIFNEDGADADFRIEGDTEPNLFFLDASQNNIGIGAAPDSNSRFVIKNLAASKDWLRFMASDGGLAAEFFENADNSAAIYLNDGASSTKVLIDTTGESYLNGGKTRTQTIEPFTDDTYYLGKNDDDTPKAWKGVILKDTTNGKYYRVEVISGVVTATDLTD